MKFLRTTVCALAVCSIGTFGVQATSTLFEYAFNLDGTVSDPTSGDAVPGAVDLSGFDTGTGLGTISVSLSGAGSRYVAVFVDHEIDEDINTYYNEYGASSGTAAAGESWEIDEPGYVSGDIYDNLLASSLDNANGVPSGFPDDVSMALAYDFILTPGDTASLDFILSSTAPSSGFYLAQTDPDSGGAIYFSSTLGITHTPQGVPDYGTTWSLLLFGLVVVEFWRRQSRIGRKANLL